MQAMKFSLAIAGALLASVAVPAWAVAAGEIPGLQVAVCKDGKPLVVKGYGAGNLELGHTALDDERAIVPGRVAGYEGDPGGYRNAARMVARRIERIALELPPLPAKDPKNEK